jgi:hypothetical protein
VPVSHTGVARARACHRSRGEEESRRKGSEVGVLEALNMTGRVQREKDKGADVIRKAQTLCEDARASQ